MGVAVEMLTGDRAQSASRIAALLAIDFQAGLLPDAKLERLTAEPGEGSENFAWTHVITIPLTSGEHVIRALVPRDGGIDLIKLVRRRSRDEDYLSLMEEAGFRGGAPAAYVTRSAAFASLSNPTFSEHARHFLTHVVEGEDPIFLVENDTEALYSRPLSPLLPPEL